LPCRCEVSREGLGHNTWPHRKLTGEGDRPGATTTYTQKGNQAMSSKATFTDDDGNVYYGQEALERGDAWIAGMEAHNRGVMARAQARPQRHVRAASRPRGSGRPAVRRSAQRSSARSGDSGDDPGEPPGHPWRSRRDPWALTWAERLPVVWRFRAARCRPFERREGVDR
jgi:hypothetical protein